MLDLDDLYGCPFKLHGRDLSGFDCYGLVIEVEKRLGRTLKDLHAEYTEDNYLQKLDENAESFIKDMELIKTEQPVLGDIILFLDKNGCSVHVGVYLKRDDFIHCDGQGVHIDNLESYFRRKWEAYTWQN